MSPQDEYGGAWTQQKLDCLQKYLIAYRQIFTKNQRAQWYKTVYVDAFAGTGVWKSPIPSSESRDTLWGADLPDAEEYRQGSARIALGLKSPFDEYLFIDKDSSRVARLEQLRDEYPHLRDGISVRQGDANQVLRDWCTRRNWKRLRAIIFLDPFSMQVEWATLEVLASTKAVDLWYLFPISSVNRLLPRQRLPESTWGERLSTILGTEEWQANLYQPSAQGRLFESEVDMVKTADYTEVGKFFLSRLSTIFHKTTSKPLVLCNSRNAPLFLLCFAAANPKGSKTAIRIASSIIGD